MKKKLLSAILVAAMACTMFTACGKKEETNKTTQKEEVVQENVADTQEATEVEESREGMLKSYFTGLWIDENLAKQRPIALMVENTSAALPQYGLNKADIVYEVPVEGGITRCMAVFQDYSGMEKLGNVRSCRHYFCYFAKEYDSIYVHAGASRYAYDGILASGYIEDIDGITGKGGTYFFRDSSEGKVAPHNYYTSSEKVAKAIEAYGYNTSLPEDFKSHFIFAKEEEQNMLENGVDAAVVKLYYYAPDAYWVYNSEDARYYRHEFDQKQMDGNDGKQVSTKNIIIQNTKSGPLDDEGRLDFSTMAGGTGYYITNGKCIEINWTRDSEYDITHYYDKDGNEITVNPGNTWIEVIENGNAKKNKIFSTVEEFEKK